MISGIITTYSAAGVSSSRMVRPITRNAVGAAMKSGRYRGVDGTSQRLVQRVVEELLAVALAIELEVLTDAVEDHHLIIDRVAYHGQDGTDEHLVDLQRHGNPAPQY